MASNEHRSPEVDDGIPRIPSGAVGAFLNVPVDSFDEQFESMQGPNQALANLIMIASEVDSPDDMEQKRAFARGAVTMYRMFAYYSQVLHLESQLAASTTPQVEPVQPPLSLN